MRSKEEALSQIVQLAGEHNITQREIATALRMSLSGKSEKSIAMRLFSYLGGIFIFAGISAYIAAFWGDMNSVMRVIITLGTGFIAYIISVILSREPERKNIVAPLMICAVLLECGGLFVLIDEYFNNHTGNWRLASLIVFGIMLVQQGLTFLSLRIPIMLFTTLWFGGSFFCIAFDMIGVSEKWNAIILGLSLLNIAYGLRNSVYHNTLQLVYLIGSFCFLGGTFAVLQNSPLEILYLALTCFMVYISIVAQSTTLLVMAVLAMLSFICYFTSKYFLNSASWPIMLMLLGCILLGISASAVKLKRKYITT